MLSEKVTTAFPISVEILHIYCSYGPHCLKMHLLLLQACKDGPYTEIAGGNIRFFIRFSAHLRKTHVWIRLPIPFSSDNTDDEPIPYLTDTTLLNDATYMSQLDAICQFNYVTCQGVCTSHSFCLTRSQAKLQKITIPILFKSNTGTVDLLRKQAFLKIPQLLWLGKG